MNVKCPYCNCSYELNNNMLREPIGDEKLGYGWWLRCYKCHKKWWLKNTTVERTINTPLKADKQAKIERISKLSKRPQKNSKPKRSFGKYIILAILLGGIALCYQYRSVFTDYLLIKAKKLSESVISKVTMTDVKYEVDDNNMLTVSGDIVNYDERMISKVNGIKISVFDDKSMVISWDSEFDDLKILPQQKVPFNVTKQLPGDVRDMRVEVSVF